MGNHLALIIEDDSGQADIFTTVLHVAGFETETIMDGQEALDRLAEISPDVLILDLHLPTISGDEILAQIRQNERLAAMQIILVTADALLARDIQRKGDIALIKPVSPAQLRILISRLWSA